MRRFLIPLVILCTLATGCAMFQSMIKSSFPYTTTFTIPSSTQPGTIYSATSMATSFDQLFSKSGDNGDRITMVRVISAKLMSTEPVDYNIGNISEVQIYLSKQDGTDEMLVASRGDITTDAGNNIVLNFDNSKFLDELVRQPEIRVRMTCKLRKTFSSDVSLHVIFGLAAYPKSDK